MLVSLKWLRDYVDLPDDVEDLAHRLTMASAEVDAIHRVGDWDRALVTVGEVVAVDPHPNADRLRLATVRYRPDAEPQQVVCGAPNLEVGQRIAFAREGAELFDGHSGERSVLKAAKIRGFESSGMVLSERELGLSDQHEGILELPADAPIGTPLADYLGDVVLDVHVWPNRADTMNMVGIAREVAAITGAGEVRVPATDYPEAGPPASEAVAVGIDDPDLCARYIATVVEGVTVGPSPEWMQARLRAAGQRPINNVVDITNYVMLELGQPLHSFDLDKVQGTVVVRRARPGERLTTLDGVDRELTEDMLLITDDSGPIALAGVMGGLATEVTESTTRILLEAATFDAASIRRTSTRQKLRSEASSRFERGLSPELPALASRRATQLLVEVAGGTARQGAVDVYPRPFTPQPVTVTRARLDTLIGFHVPDDEVVRGLETLGFEVEAGQQGGEPAFAVTPPWWRTDVSIPDDVVEEVVRLAGYDRLPASTPRGAIPSREPRPLIALRERLRDALVRAGMQETITYSLTTDEVLARVLPAEDLAIIRPLRLRNTLSSDREVLRPTLRHAVLETVERNIRAGAESIAVFEAARAFIPQYGEGRPLPEEREFVTGAVSGVDLDRWSRPSDRRLDFFDAKGTLEAAFESLGVEVEYVAEQEYGLLPGRTARLYAGTREARTAFGVLGEVHPQTLAAFDIEQPAVLFEIDLAALLPLVPARIEAQPVPRFPAVEQDLAVVVDADTPASSLLAEIEASQLVAEARVFDVYRGDRVGAGKKSVAIAIRYQSPDRTLTTDDANAEQARIVRRLAARLGAEQRG